jgi:hypothetical protein
MSPTYGTSINSSDCTPPQKEYIIIQYIYNTKESLGLQRKPWFDEECLGMLDQRKHAKMQWRQDPSQSNTDNINNVRRDASRHFRNKKKAYLKAKIEELKN